MTSGDFHTDLSENITAVVSNVIIESNSMFFSRFSIPLNFYLEGVVILTPTLILPTMGKVPCHSGYCLLPEEREARSEVLT